MGDELRGENLVHLNVRFSTETELKKIQDFLYEKSGQGVSFTGLVEAMANEGTKMCIRDRLKPVLMHRKIESGG